MQASMNIPYVKHFDENGTLTNPITGTYPQPFDNRRTRRFSEPRFLNNRKGVHLQDTGHGRVFRKVLQNVYKLRAQPKGKRKYPQAPIYDQIGVVKHYLLK